MCRDRTFAQKTVEIEAFVHIEREPRPTSALPPGGQRGRGEQQYGRQAWRRMDLHFHGTSSKKIRSEDNGTANPTSRPVCIKRFHP